ncbi:MAG: aminotransferase class I/II-fold pyridoxal phosphate-dependent enzyme [Flavobacteriales bacterium]|nr:aminotransferase class I/II-fold pyridoxal phosphate-dependent enzyme [Flavobacteriales bacterium]
MIINQANRLNEVKEYYFSTKLQEIAKMRASGLNVLNLGIGSPDLAPSDATIDALIEAAKIQSNHAYQPYRGINELREGIAGWYKSTYGVDLNSTNEILPLIGSKEGIMHISMAFLNEGDQVLVPNPGYPTYSSVSKLVGAEIVEYELNEANNWAPDFEALENSDLSKVKIMWVNYPNMPTGAAATDEVFSRLIEFGKKHQILICNDNPYSLVLNTDAPKSILSVDGAKDVAIELNSLSKSHNMAGWRIGFVSGAAEYINTIIKVKSNMDSGMFLPLQKAAVEALKNSDEWHQQRNEIYKERRELAWNILESIGCTFDKTQVGMFVWAKVGEDVASVEEFVDEFLQEANVFITPGFIFGSKGEGYVRISLCSDTKVLEEALGRISKVMDSKKATA